MWVAGAEFIFDGVSSHRRFLAMADEIKLCGPRKFARNMRTYSHIETAGTGTNDFLASANAGRSCISFGLFLATSYNLGPKDLHDASGNEAFLAFLGLNNIFRFDEYGDIVTGEWTWSSGSIGAKILVCEVYWP